MMNKDQTKQAIAVMQGYVDGKTIQYRYDEKQAWTTLTRYPNWDWTEVEYRIKPEMVKCRRYLYKQSSGMPTVGITQLPVRVLEIEGFLSFIRWIDLEWQEVEI